MRRVSSWVGVAACSVIGLAWAVSGWARFGVVWSRTNEMTRVEVVRGLAAASRTSFPGIAASSWRWSAERLGGAGGWDWWWWRERGMHLEGVGAPLWWAGALAGAVTVWAWWPRRGREGRCARCGYERGALAVCPECGAVAGHGSGSRGRR